MGVLYHLRHPLLALDLIHEHVAGDLMVFQSMQRGVDDSRCRVAEDYRLLATATPFDEPGYPEAAFHRAAATPATRPTGGRRTAPASRRCCAAPASTIIVASGGGGLSSAARAEPHRHGDGAVYPAQGTERA